MGKPQNTSAICGLFCDACGIYIATTEEPDRLERIAAAKGTVPDDVRCLGCRSDVLYPHCRTCKMKACAEERGLDFCSHCSDYPCEILRDFQIQRPHRITLFESLEDIRDHGEPAWRARMESEYRCESCGTMNQIYDSACRHCSHTPPNRYVGRYQAEIEAGK